MSALPEIILPTHVVLSPRGGAPDRVKLTFMIEKGKAITQASFLISSGPEDKNTKFEQIYLRETDITEFESAKKAKNIFQMLQQAIAHQCYTWEISLHDSKRRLTIIID